MSNVRVSGYRTLIEVLESLADIKEKEKKKHENNNEMKTATAGNGDSATAGEEADSND